VTPFDLGMDWIVSKAKGDFIGKRGLARPDLVAAGRRQLVGLLTDSPEVVLEEGAQLVEPAFAGRRLAPMIGHVTSAYFSPVLGKSIALALVQGGHARHGSKLAVPTLGDRPIAVTVTPPIFFDPEGTRLNG
jgi:sarcosine oxidase subunit alpha